jgi:two-component system sensor histidine kinase DegS
MSLRSKKAMTITQTQQDTSEWEVLKKEVEEELDRSRRELKEIALMLEQSQLEVGKLAQRSASITAHLQHVQAQLDSLPRADIRMAYESALDAQQRLFVMRGQLEKLQTDQARLDQYVKMIARVEQLLEGGQPAKLGGRSGATVQTVEMLVQAQEAERQRLSRQMHDGPAQALSNFILQTEIAMRLFDIDQAKARKELEELKQSATSTFQKVRDFIFDLRPMMLDDLGLVPTLKRYVDVLKDHFGTDVRLVVTGNERRLEPYLEVMIFRALQELLNNSVREGQASQVKLQLDMGETNVKITCEDNGKGFDIESLQEPGYMGLKVIKDRVEMLGGYFEIHSVISQGTAVTLQIPASIKAG